MKRLPDGWSRTSLSNIAKLNMGQSPDGEFTNVAGDGIPLIGGAADFKDGNIKSSRYTSRPTKVSTTGDLILCIRATIGKVAISDRAYCLGRGVAGITPFTDTKWLYYNLIANANDLDKAGTGTTFRQIDKKTLAEWPISLAPFLEQKRIVSKVEAILFRLKQAGDQLNIVKKLVEDYKKSILKSAFNGDLTLNWRKANFDNNISTTNTWNTFLLSEISNIQTGLALGKKRKSSDITYRKPYLRVANVQRGYLDLSEVKYIDVTKAEFEKLQLQSGDILMNEGGDRDKLGRGWVWNEQIEDCIHQNHVFRIRLNDKAFPPEWISYYANEFGQQYFFDEGQQTTNLASISKAKISALPVPMPTADEANEIIRRLKEIFARIDHVVLKSENAVRLIDALYKVALEKAFAGELLPQHASDEPASSFLSRIQVDMQSSEEKLFVQKKVSIRGKKSMNKELIKVLEEADDWLDAQYVFSLCGITNNASTEEIEIIYSELRDLDQKGLLLIETMRDKNGSKLYDRIKLNKKVNYAS